MTGLLPTGGGAPQALGPPAPPSGPSRSFRSSPERRRAWLSTAVVALLVLLYLTLWSTYAAVHTGDRYRQLAPGAVGTRGEAQFRVLSMVRADRLTGQQGEDPQSPEPDAVFVVAELEMLQQRAEEFVSCSDTDLLGPGGRVWEPTITKVQRRTAYCDSDNVEVGQPYRFENVYEVPLRDADQVVGIALVDVSTPDRTPVMRPPA